MPRITLSTDQVREIASALNALNLKLRDTLNESQAEINALGRNWTGEAYEATKAAFDSFAQKYFQQYQDLIDNYVRFLNTNVADAYDTVENSATQLADAFR